MIRGAQRARVGRRRGAKLRREFFTRTDVARIGRELLGQYLFTRFPGQPLTGGMIVETEAYGGATDRASHAYGHRRTRRTEIMYATGGVAYVYLCYGLHALFNIITNGAGAPDAVLIRALEPTHGLATMLRRRRRTQPTRALTGGPGVLAEALGIRVAHSGWSVVGDCIWLEKGRRVAPRCILAGPRVGVGYAGPDARRPWRFRLRDSAWTSPAR